MFIKWRVFDRLFCSRRRVLILWQRLRLVFIWDGGLTSWLFFRFRWLLLLGHLHPAEAVGSWCLFDWSDFDTKLLALCSLFADFAIHFVAFLLLHCSEWWFTLFIRNLISWNGFGIQNLTKFGWCLWVRLFRSTSLCWFFLFIWFSIFSRFVSGLVLDCYSLLFRIGLCDRDRWSVGSGSRFESDLHFWEPILILCVV